MSAGDEKEKNNKTNEEKIKKQMDKFLICPYCQKLVELIWIHGHYQCPACKNVVVGCCGDE